MRLNPFVGWLGLLLLAGALFRPLGGQQVQIPQHPHSVNTIWHGAGTPSYTLGNDGDFYLDTVATALYGPKASGAWPGAVSLIGAAGAAGATGATGAQGPPGDSGSYNRSNAEVPDGTIDGTNVTFALAHPPVQSSLLLIRNGLVMALNEDYTLTGAAVTFINGAEPYPGDILLAYYSF